MQDKFAYCQDLVRVADKDRFLAALFASADRRGDLFALYAFNVEIARVRELAREPLPGEIRLQWWREVIEGIRADEAAAHPVAAALLDTVARRRLLREKLVDLIDARVFDLYDDPMETKTSLRNYALRTSSTLIELAMVILGGDGAADVAASAGIAYAITGLLRALPLHASRRQLYLPLDLLDRHGASAEEILAGHSSPKLGAALAELRADVRCELERIADAQTTLSQDIFPALLPVSLVPAYLGRMDRRDYDPFKIAVEMPQWRRQWVLWRAARRGRILP